MKRILAILTLAAMTLVAVPAFAQLPTVGGAAIAYNAVGIDHDAGDRWSTYYYAGLRMFKPDSTSSVYGVVHYLNVNGTGVSGWGGKMVLVSQIPESEFFLLSGLGFLSTIAEQSDGSETTGLMADFAVSWQASSMIDVAAGIQAVDRGPEFSLSIHGTFIVKNISALIPGA